MPTTDCEVITALADAVSGRIGERRYELWFANRTKFALEGDLLTVGVPNRFYQEWLQKTFTADVAAVAGELLGGPVEVRFVIDPELFQAAREAEKAPAAPPPPPPEPAQPPRGARAAAEPTADEDGLAERPAAKKAGRRRLWRGLGEFVVGPCNRVAHAAALAVVDAPGLEVNPLVIHGPVGTGKTHLLEGIYLGLRKSNPGWGVCFVTAEDFTNRFVQAMRLSKLGSFRRQFRDCDALLLDDLHFLASKRATQEEFLHTFDALSADGRQVVVTCDCHPRLNDQLLPELADRLLGGAVWGVMPPDFDTRLNLLRAKSLRQAGAAVPEEVLMLVADLLKGNVRELEGALNSLLHYAKATGRKLDTALAREALGELLRHSVRVVQPPEVDRAVCDALQMEHGSLQSKNRSWAYSHPRMVAMYLARKHTGATYTEIGRYFGNRSHSTVVAAEKKVRLWLEKNEVLALGNRHVRVRDLIDKAERGLLQ